MAVVRVKICGITNPEDAWLSVDAGADALGFIFYKGSPRHINPDEAKAIVSTLPPFLTTVGVFVDEEIERVIDIADYLGLTAIQLHGNESPEYCRRLSRRIIKTIKVPERVSTKDLFKSISDYDNISAILLDTCVRGKEGGTGRIFNWDIAIEAKRYGRIILAGGLTPENVVDAIERVKPYGVDVCSGVESEPGRKDPKRLRDFVNMVKALSLKDIRG